MDVANLNPMVAPVQAVQPVQPVQSGGGGTFIYAIVVVMLLLSLIATGYLFYKSQSPRVVDQFPPGYVGPKPDPTPTPTPDTAPTDISEDDIIVTVEPPDTEPITVKQVDNVTEDVSSVEREMADLGTDVEQEPQTETPTPASPSIEQEPQTETPTLNDIIENITLTSPSVEQETPTPASPSVEQETPTLNDISAKITFVSPSVEQDTPTLDNVQTQVELVTPVVTTTPTPTPTPTLGNIRERVKL